MSERHAALRVADKDPELRLQTLELAGQASVPFTTGILIGIGETRLERIESLLAIRRLHEQYGHIQEVIVQNFRAKPHTKMAQAPEPDLEELIWTLAVTRLIFGPQMNIQAPPNLSPGVLPQLISGGINDWGGVSPVTPDHVNPEAPGLIWIIGPANSSGGQVPGTASDGVSRISVPERNGSMNPCCRPQ